MLNVILRTLLYSILTICICWGMVLFLAPQVITLYLNKKFGDTVKVYNLNISPKLVLEISRVEFLDSNILPNHIFNGSLRAIELNWRFNESFRPEVVVSTGPLISESFTKLSSAMLTFEMPRFWGDDKVNFNFNLENFGLAGFYQSELFKANGVYEPKSRQFSNLEFSGSGVSISSEAPFTGPSFHGVVVRANLDSNYGLSSIEGFSLTSPELYSEKQDIFLDSLSANLDFEKNLGRLDLRIGELSSFYGEVSLEKVSLNASLNSLNTNGWDFIAIKAENLNLLNELYFGVGSALENVETELKKTSSEKINVQSRAHFADFHIKNGDGILADLTGSRINLESHLVGDTFTSKVYFQSASSPTATIDGQVKLAFPSTDFMLCVEWYRCRADFWSDYILAIGSNKLIGSSQCVLPRCFINGSKHTIRSDNTIKFFEQASRSKIFNPFLLAVLFSNFSDGRKMGSGHMFQF